MTKDQVTSYSNKEIDFDLPPSDGPEGILNLSIHQPIETWSFSNLSNTPSTSHGGPQKEGLVILYQLVTSLP